MDFKNSVKYNEYLVRSYRPHEGYYVNIKVFHFDRGREVMIQKYPECYYLRENNAYHPHYGNGFLTLHINEMPENALWSYTDKALQDLEFRILKGEIKQLVFEYGH